MADFEVLIKNALASQDIGDPDVREAVYQSSRNALKKIIDTNRSMTVERAMEERKVLEDVIARIELEITAPPPPAQPEPEPEPEPVQDTRLVPEQIKMTNPVASPPAKQPSSSEPDQSDPFYEIGQIMTGDDGPRIEGPAENVSQVRVDPNDLQDSQNDISHEYRPFDVSGLSPDGNSRHAQATADEIEADLYVADTMGGVSIPETVNLDDAGDVPEGFTKRRRKQKIAGWLITIAALIALIVWGGYAVYEGIEDGSLLGFDQSADANRNNESANAAEYITILSPSDLSSLVVAGRGSAGIITKQNTQMIRIASQRDTNNRQQPAEPILFRLKPGVLEQIQNKRVTVEIYAKSDTNEQAQFSVACQFANGSDCGRKRFVAGVQPQASIFELDFGPVNDTGEDYYITINTDTTNEAAITGEGDVLDIVYVRLRPSDNT